jgi:CBS domain-containing protein
MYSIKTVVDARQTMTVGPLVSVLEAARAMTDRQIGALPIVENDRLVGIFTERDVLARVVANGLDPAATSVGSVMSTTLVMADASEPYDVCMERMKQAHVRHLLVLENGRLAGILSLRDLLTADLNEKNEAITLLNAYVHCIPANYPARV